MLSSELISRPSDAQLVPGWTILSNLYRLEEPVARSATLALFRGRCISKLGSVMISTPVVRPAPLRSTRRHLDREANLLLSLRHPHVIRLLDFRSETNRDFWVHEGYDTQNALSPTLLLDAQQALEILHQALDTFERLHEAGVMHGDLSPCSLLWSNGTLQVRGFGFAPLTDLMIARGRSCESVRYASPERLMDGIIDEQADLYALAKSLQACMDRNGDPTASAIQEVLEQATDARRERRFRDAADMRSALDVLVERRGKTQPTVLPAGVAKAQRDSARNMVRVPGAVLSSKYSSTPIRTQDLLVDKTCVTNAMYWLYVRSVGVMPPAHWVNGAPPEHELNLPVIGVRLVDAMRYAAWVNKRLPTCDEWEAIARSPTGASWPWGEEFDPERCNCPTESHAESGTGLSHVTSYPSGANAFGVLDLIGNAQEWVMTPPNRIGPGSGKSWVIGGSYREHPNDSGVIARRTVDPSACFDDVGFRCVRVLT